MKNGCTNVTIVVILTYCLWTLTPKNLLTIERAWDGSLSETVRQWVSHVEELVQLFG